MIQFVRLSFVCLAVLMSVSNGFAWMGGDFPTSPNFELTPGSLCSRPDSYRYPEHIAYCERDVSKGEKYDIIETYDNQLGYRIGQMNRQDFKIDHLIPLCAGGSNEADNLWPQHKSIYELTDPLEQRACEMLAQGRMKQAEVIDMILEAKRDPTAASQMMGRLYFY